MKAMAGSNAFELRAGTKAARVQGFTVLGNAFAPGKKGEQALRKLGREFEIDSKRLGLVAKGTLNLSAMEIDKLRRSVTKRKSELGKLMREAVEQIDFDKFGRPGKAAPLPRSRPVKVVKHAASPAPPQLKATPTAPKSLLKVVSQSGIFSGGVTNAIEVRDGLVVLMRPGASLQVKAAGNILQLAVTLARR